MPVWSTGSTGSCSRRRTRRCRAVTSERVEELGHVGGHGLGERGDVLEQGFGDGVAREVPDHGAQFEDCREAQPVVDAPHPAVVAAQHVPAFAVRVVGDVIEQGDPRQVAVGLRDVGVQGEVMLTEVAVDEPLQRTDPQGGVLADHRRRHDSPAKGLAEQVRRAFPPVQSGLEIGQRPFPGLRLVDRIGGVVPAGDLHQERLVAAARDASEQLDLALGEQGQLPSGHRLSHVTLCPMSRHLDLHARSPLSGSDVEFTMSTAGAWPSA